VTGSISLPDGTSSLVDPEDFARFGHLRWCLKRKRSQPGRVYVQRTVVRDGRKTAVMLHREIMSAAPGQLVDHRNGDTRDNRRSNLRICTARENTTNVTRSKLQKLGGYKGVSWHPGARKWQANICAGEPRANGKRKQVYLGLFTDPVAAAHAYDAAALKHFGEFAALNFPEEVRHAG
jgi:hypothetical protein